MFSLGCPGLYLPWTQKDLPASASPSAEIYRHVPLPGFCVWIFFFNINTRCKTLTKDKVSVNVFQQFNFYNNYK